MNINNYLNGVPTTCMNVGCNNNCTKMYILLMGTQKVIHYFCEEHYEQFIEEILGGIDE